MSPEPEYHTSTYCSDSACVEVAYQRSSFCSGGNCVEVGYHTSTYSAGGDCVEVGNCNCDTGTVYVRDSKNPTGGTLAFPVDVWNGFLDQIAAGKLTFEDADA